MHKTGLKIVIITHFNPKSLTKVFTIITYAKLQRAEDCIKSKASGAATAILEEEIT